MTDEFRALESRWLARVPGARAVQPRRAATLIITRTDGPQPQILMGRRNSGHNFMPNAWVFPGGRVDPADFHAPYAADLRPEVAQVFEAHMPMRRARALALAAIRETFEEAGLLLARAAPARPGVGGWREFLAQGALPDLSALGVLGRAITPPMIGKRFDTWFFTADAERLLTLERRPDCGELDEIDWVSFEDVPKLDPPDITLAMLTHARRRIADPALPRPFFRHRHGKLTLTHL
jgi:8-oxo-dGTP pyrophosphatase MutT (NUDIX family)